MSFKYFYSFLITILFFLMTTNSSAQTNQLVYIGDPMCSWCYGFGPELDKVKAAFPELEFQMVMGGLRPYGKQKMTELSDFLKHHWEEIHERTGQEFKYDILSNPDFVYDTEPASRAVVSFIHLGGKDALHFFHKVQASFYKDNKNPHDVNTYLPLLQAFNIDEKEFATAFASEEMEKATLQGFQYAGQLGVRGFPSMILKQGDDFTLISNGYQEAEKIINTIKAKLR